MSTVTIPRELAQSLLVLMTRDAMDADVPAGQWLTFANALDKAMHAPRTPEDAPGSTQPADPTQGPPRTLPLAQTGMCRFCKASMQPLPSASGLDRGLCASCADDLLRDAQEAEARPCPRCAHE